MRRATLVALILAAGVALAQNPFRDLAPAPEPEPEPTVSAPITIDIPEAPLPAPPTDVSGFPALPAPGALEGDATAPGPAAPTINIPDQPVVFALPPLNGAHSDAARNVSLRNPLLTPRATRVQPLLEPLPILMAHEPAEEPETAGEEIGQWCVDAAVLATSGGHAPTALIRCDDATHLLRVGDTIPGTDATIETIDPLGVTIAAAGQGHQLQLAAH